MADKNHVRYEADLRLRAEAARLGLVTVHVRFPDGSQKEYQVAATPDECRFADWAGALVEHREVRPLPDLGEMVKTHFPQSSHEGSA